MTRSSLFRLIYISSARGEMTQHDLDKILALSRTNNAARHVTGMLLFHDGCFFQVLEGEMDAVKHTFTTISSDARHSGVIVLESRDITERGFPHWSMGYVGAHALHPDQRQWMVDLSTRVASNEPAPLTDVDRVNIHIESFLSSFREFA